MDAAERAQLGGAGIAVLLALLAAVRSRLRSGKRLMPKVRLRGYVSIRSPDTDPPPVDPMDRQTPVVKRKRGRDADDDQT